jgi:two-component system, LytTR family, response regulator
MINCIIVDNIKDMVELMESHVQAIPELNLKATFTNPFKALEYLADNKIDLVFLDIEMPKMSGLDLIQRLRTESKIQIPSFILVTGYAEYAIQSYEYDVEDYIMKPVTYKRFSASIDKYLKASLTIVNSNVKYEDFIFADHEGKKVKINIDDIIYIESAGNYINFHKYNERIIVYKTLQSIIDIIDPKLFVRVHKSYVVAIKHVMALQNSELIMNTNNHRQILIGDSYKKSVMKRLNIV